MLHPLVHKSQVIGEVIADRVVQLREQLQVQGRQGGMLAHLLVEELLAVAQHVLVVGGLLLFAGFAFGTGAQVCVELANHGADDSQLAGL